ncbi:bifunctional 4-hydroxy-2-oxoglutarate aldolase/2-dehydro-3-deoxy-phosphogluconate aldolase [Bacillus sp. USDA818B3_A]|uniref:bifunctional 4-hydroxy-2-oxoglutarate aldolase/2-dehydro-3-deoxy-phosphogluconate aldolase n=1 Tax=Bacillus sp. USDA818B3_A TaxID=2698834 RepID=UPI00136F5F03|nr:bifunctional 4-hydroxy-2-oxoglutarate aldolase/2-dehydro-3-deoxy-phosphogluconate aldolase [Bacillus sp. USDA818B3_A]
MQSKVRLIEKLVDCGVIAVIRGIPEEKIMEVAQSLIAGGVTALEVTVDTPESFRSINRLSNLFKDRAIIGAGSVQYKEGARLAIESGAEFVLSTNLHKDVIHTTLKYGKVAIPRVMKMTEMVSAIESGADLVKVFPAAGLGLEYIKDVTEFFSHVPIISAGGIHLDNVASFIESGVSAVGIGGNLVDCKAIAASDFMKIMRTAKEYVSIIQNVRANIYNVDGKPLFPLGRTLL